MRVITFHTYKGGVGKTTLAVNLALLSNSDMGPTSETLGRIGNLSIMFI